MERMQEWQTIVLARAFVVTGLCLVAVFIEVMLVLFKIVPKKRLMPLVILDLSILVYCLFSAITYPLK
jgi:hypothetical protein